MVPVTGSVCSWTVYPLVPLGQSPVKLASALAPVGAPACVTTWTGAGACFEEPPERPIRTPTPIASSSTPTPASRLTVLPRGS